MLAFGLPVHVVLVFALLTLPLALLGIACFGIAGALAAPAALARRTVAPMQTYAVRLPAEDTGSGIAAFEPRASVALAWKQKNVKTAGKNVKTTGTNQKNLKFVQSNNKGIKTTKPSQKAPK